MNEFECENVRIPNPIELLVTSQPSKTLLDPNILNFDLNTTPTPGKVVVGGIDYGIDTGIQDIDANATCTMWLESSNGNDPGLINPYRIQNIKKPHSQRIWE